MTKIRAFCLEAFLPRHAPLCLPLRPATVAVLCLCAIAAVVPQARAERYEQNWSVHAFGIKVGNLQVAVEESGATVSGAAQFQTTGLAGILRRIRFQIQSQSRKTPSSLRAQSYAGVIHTGKRLSETSLQAQDGRLVKTAGLQAPATPIAPDATLGALDPMTMLWLTLRDQTAQTLCQIEETQFDGTRLVRITLKTRIDTLEHVTCQGTYDRIGGYSDAELAELKTSPLSIVYAKQGAIWRAQTVYLTSRHGRAKVRRID